VEIISRREAIERGLGRYFTGEACKHGHVAERRTVNSTCVACIRGWVKKEKKEAAKKIAEIRALAVVGSK
jgi:hypothetical protein